MREEEQEFQEALKPIREILFQKREWNFEDRIKLAETVRFLSKFLEQGNLNDNERGWVDSWIEECQHVLHLGFEFNLVMTMQYYRRNLGKNPYGAHLPPLASIFTLEALETRGSKINRGDTRWEKAGDFILRLADDIDSIFRSSSSDPGDGAAWFITLNAIEFLDSLDDNSAFQSAYGTFLQTVEEHEQNLKAEMTDSPGLRAYAHDLYARGILPIEVEEPTGNLPDKAQIFRSLNRLSRGETVSSSDLPDSLPEDKTHLWGIARAWARDLHGEPTGILPPHGQVDLDEVFRRVWGDQKAIQNTNITEDDLSAVRSMKDDDLQDSIVEIFRSNDYVTNISKGTLDLERDKAHTGIEISDFDIEIQWGDDTTIPVSLPIKSAHEASGRTADQLAEDNLHQVIRPLSRLGSPFGAVFPILIAGQSVNANETMKFVRINLELPIVPIGEKTFARILKHHGLI